MPKPKLSSLLFSLSFLTLLLDPETDIEEKTLLYHVVDVFFWCSIKDHMRPALLRPASLR